MDLKKLDVKNTEVKLGEKYLLKERLGGGSFGQIFCAVNIDNLARVAAKMEKRSVNATLIREAKVISDMRGHTGFPSLYDYGKEENYNYIIISLLGWNLEKLFKLCSQRFSLKTVLMIADQLISRIETLHSKNYIHRDIKPENFCIGKGSSGRNVFLIDFGLAKAFKDAEGKHISFKDGKGLIGTARYASINAHLGYELSRRDDLESIGYALIYFLAGKLPWQNLKVEEKQEKYQRIAELKIQTPTDQLCQGLPVEFLTYLNYVKKLEFEEIPDYKYLKKLFRTLFVEYGYDFDYNYDWLDVLKTQYSIETALVPAPLKVKDPAREEEPKKQDAATSIQIPQKGDVADSPSPSNKKQRKEDQPEKKSNNELKVHNGPSSFIMPIRKRSSSRPTIILNDKKVKSTTEQNIQQPPAFRKSLNATTAPKIALIESESKREDNTNTQKKSFVRGSFPMNISSNSAFSSKNLHYNMTPSIINEDRDDDIPTEALENMLGSTVGKIKQFSVKKKDISVKATDQLSPMSPKDTSFKQHHGGHGGRKSFNHDIKKAQFPSFLDSRRSPLNDFSLLDPKRTSPRWSDAHEYDVYGEGIILFNNSS